MGLISRSKTTFNDKTFHIKKENLSKHNFIKEKCRIVARWCQNTHSKMIIFSTKVLITGTTCILDCIVCVVWEDNTSSDFQLNYHAGFIFITVLGVFLISSTFLDIYSDMVEDNKYGNKEPSQAELENINAKEENALSYDVNSNFKDLI